MPTRKRTFRGALHEQRFTLANTIAASGLISQRLRLRLLRLAGLEIGDDTWIRPGVIFHSLDVAIGEGCAVNAGCIIDGNGRVEIGDRAGLGIGTILLTTTHNVGPSEWRWALPATDGFVRIGRGAWVGARTVVLPNVTIGDGCVIGANSVVMRDTEPNGLYAGTPARLIRSLPLGAIPPSDNGPSRPPA